MILDIEQSLHLCDWLIGKGLGLGEAAEVLSYMVEGDTFCLAVMKVFRNRKNALKEMYDKNYTVIYDPNRLP